MSKIIHTDPDGRTVQTIASRGSPEGERYAVSFGEAAILIPFQTGNPAEVGVNGITLEALLQVNIHRLTICNEQFFCEENLNAITAMQQALSALEARTANRKARGVHGTRTV